MLRMVQLMIMLMRQNYPCIVLLLVCVEFIYKKKCRMNNEDENRKTHEHVKGLSTVLLLRSLWKQYSALVRAQGIQHLLEFSNSTFH